MECVLDFVQREPAVVEWFRHVLAPEEIFFQTVLENSPGIVLERDCRRYFDFSRTRENHPAVLQGGDLDAVVSSGAWFARKVEIGSSDALVAGSTSVLGTTWSDRPITGRTPLGCPGLGGAR